MTFKNLFIEHELSEDVEAWLEEEIAEQEARFSEIEQSMKDIAPQRAKWYEEFFDRITTTGFSVDGDLKEVISKDKLPVKPKGREDLVVWKHGVDVE